MREKEFIMAKILISPSKYIQGAGEMKKLGTYADSYGKKALVLISKGGHKRIGADVYKRQLQGGCSAPSAAYAKMDAKTQTLWLRGMYCPQEGMSYLKGEREGTPDQAEAIGKALAE